MLEYKNKIKKYIIILSFVSILVMAFVSILVMAFVSIPVMASTNADMNSNDTNDTVKFSIKSKFLEQDKNWNTEIIRINITVDRLGKLIYKENYYLEGSTSLKFQSSAKYFDAIMTDKNISFNISRPKPGRISDRKYVFVESIILFDNKIIFNRLANLSNRYKLDFTNVPVRPKTVTKTPKNLTTNKTIDSANTTKNNNTNTEKNNNTNTEKNNNTNTEKNNNTNTEKNTTYIITKKDIEINRTIPPEKTNGFEVIIAIIAISTLYILRFRNEK